jgi:gamma-glutamyltranspeptidase/glutathione hydrolase
MNAATEPRRLIARTLVGAAVVLAFTLTAQAERPPATPGVPPGQTLPPPAQGNPPPWAGGPFYRQGVVAVANPYGAQAGARILEEGGNAVDAAVAIAYALNVVEPQSAGIGGGGFMMIHLARTGETFAIDSRERAPAGAKPDMFKGLSFPQASTSGFAVGVPGMVRGTALAIENWGRLSLAQVLAPAIRLADEGFAATPRFVSSPSCTNSASRARVYPETAAYFCPGGAAIPVGTIVRNEPLANTFRKIAAEGPDAFYTGEIAQAIVAGQQRFVPGGQAGSMTLADLAAYEPTIRKPVVGKYRGYTIKAMSSPSSGGLTLLQMLGMIERFPIGDASQGFGFGTTATLNVMVEAMRLGFEDRRVWMGDADFSYVPAKGLIDPVYTLTRGAGIKADARLAPDKVVPGDPRQYDTAAVAPREYVAAGESFAGPGGSTTHFVVVDKWGNMVSYTNTIESGYGAGMFAGKTQPDGSFKSYGFLLNNELTDFNFTPNVNAFPGEEAPNDVEPGKRPRSSMVPTMIFDAAGKPVVAFGSPGGSTIINSVFNVTLNLLDHGMTIQQAIDAPRISATSVSGTVGIDVGSPVSPSPFPPESIDGLKKLGHAVGSPADIGSVQAVVVDAQTGKQYGAADARREGTVIGLPRALGGK